MLLLIKISIIFCHFYLRLTGSFSLLLMILYVCSADNRIEGQLASLETDTLMKKWSKTRKIRFPVTRTDYIHYCFTALAEIIAKDSQRNWGFCMMKSIAMLRYSRTKIEDHNWFRIRLCKYLKLKGCVKLLRNVA